VTANATIIPAPRLPLAILAAIALPVFANGVVPGLGVPLAILFSAAVALGGIGVMELIIASLLFQNVFIAITAGLGGGFDHLNLARATNFIVCGTVWCVVTWMYATSWRTLDARLVTLMNAGYGMLLLVAIYFCYGFLAQPGAAVIYLRNLAFPIFCLQIGLYAGGRSVSSASTAMWTGYLLLAYCYLELVFGTEFLSFVFGDAYLLAGRQDMEEQFDGIGEAHQRIQDVGDVFATQLFNTALLGDFGYFYRLNGPNLHPISLGYALATFGLLCAIRRWFLGMALYIPVIIFSGSKGAISYLVLTLIGATAAAHCRGNTVLWSFGVVTASYAACVFVIGLSGGDYHVLGLIGSVRALVSNPVGHGLGAGGNLASTMTEASWQDAQHQGFTDVAVESSIGVLIYQMGVAGALAVAFYAWVAMSFWRLHRERRDPHLRFGAFGTLALLANGLFQEEALFAPLCLGLVLLIAGSAVSAALVRSGGPVGTNSLHLPRKPCPDPVTASHQRK